MAAAGPQHLGLASLYVELDEVGRPRQARAPPPPPPPSPPAARDGRAARRQSRRWCARVRLRRSVPSDAPHPARRRGPRQRDVSGLEGAPALNRVGRRDQHGARRSAARCSASTFGSPRVFIRSNGELCRCGSSIVTVACGRCARRGASRSRRARPPRAPCAQGSRWACSKPS